MPHLEVQLISMLKKYIFHEAKSFFPTITNFLAKIIVLNRGKNYHLLRLHMMIFTGCSLMW